MSNKESNSMHEALEQKIDQKLEENKLEDKLEAQLTQPTEVSDIKLEPNSGKAEDADPEPFEQHEVIEDYPMDSLYNKKKVPYIEKNNGSICLKDHSDYKKAIEHYNKALFSVKILVEDKNLNVGEDYIVKVLKEVEIPVSSNLTLCYLKEGDYDNVIKYADRLLQSDPDNLKILYRRGMAHTHKMQFDDAKRDLMRANKLEPKNKVILDGLKEFKQKKYDYKYKTQKICQKIFDKDSSKIYEEKEVVVKKEVDEVNNMEKGTIPYYLRVILELTFAIPLLMYKYCVEKPATKLLNFAAWVISIPDCFPIVGGLWNKIRTTAADFAKDKLGRILDRRGRQQDAQELQAAEVDKKNL